MYPCSRTIILRSKMFTVMKVLKNNKFKNQTIFDSLYAIKDEDVEDIPVDETSDEETSDDETSDDETSNEVEVVITTPKGVDLTDSILQITVNGEVIDNFSVEEVSEDDEEVTEDDVEEVTEDDVED